MLKRETISSAHKDHLIYCVSDTHQVLDVIGFNGVVCLVILGSSNNGYTMVCPPVCAQAVSYGFTTMVELFYINLALAHQPKLVR